MGDRNPNYGVAALAATEAIAHYGRGNLDATLAYVGLADAYLDLAETEDTLADALRVGLEECEALRAERDAERLDAKSYRLLLLGDYAALGRALGLGSAPMTIDQATEAARALLVERNALRAALAVQAAAVRQHDAAQATLRAAEARDAATLRRREATPGDTLAELATAHEEARRWNARATELETERDETLRRVRVALGAFGVAGGGDPIVALEALAEDTHRRKAGALDEHADGTRTAGDGVAVAVDHVGTRERLLAIVRNARKLIVRWEHRMGCGAGYHIECGPSMIYPDGTIGGEWLCHDGLGRDRCEVELRKCNCGLGELREALEVNRG